MVYCLVSIVLVVFSSFSALAEDVGLVYRGEDGVEIASDAVSSDVEVRVHGVVASHRISQRFVNDTGRWLEAAYIYPLPESSAVDHLAIKIDEKVIVGFVAPKKEARAIYKAAKAKGQVASLVEQERANVFRTQIANIAPGAVVYVEIGFQSEVKYRDGRFSMRFPTAMTPRYGAQDVLAVPIIDVQAPELVAANDNTYALRVLFDDQVAMTDFRSVAAEVSVRDVDQFRIVAADTESLGGRDFDLSWRMAEAGVSAMGFAEEIDGEYFHEIVIVPDVDMAGFTATPARQVTYIIDVSGSMAGQSLRQAKRALVLALKGLKSQDRFNVIAFSDEAVMMFGAPVEASAVQVGHGVAWVEALETIGGTNMVPAVMKAMGQALSDDYLGQIVFMTDGAISNEMQLQQIIRENGGSNRFFAVGIGYAPNMHLMEMLADTGRGLAVVISDLSQVEQVMGDLFAKMGQPVMRSIQVAFLDNENIDVVPRVLPDLLAGEVIRMTVRSDEKLGRIRMAGMMFDGDVWDQKLEFGRMAEVRGVSKIYARRQVDALKYAPDQALKGAELKAAVTRIGIKHQILTDYTSLVAVDDELLRPYWEKLAARKILPNLPSSWVEARSEGRYVAQVYRAMADEQAKELDRARELGLDLPQTATGFELRLMIGVIFMMMASGMVVVMRGKGGRYV